MGAEAGKAGWRGGQEEDNGEGRGVYKLERERLGTWKGWRRISLGRGVKGGCEGSDEG